MMDMNDGGPLSHAVDPVSALLPLPFAVPASPLKKRKKLAPGDPIEITLHHGEPALHADGGATAPPPPPDDGGGGIAKAPSEWMLMQVPAAPPSPPPSALALPAGPPPRTDGKPGRSEKKKAARDAQKDLIAKLDYLLPVRGEAPAF